MSGQNELKFGMWAARRLVPAIGPRLSGLRIRPDYGLPADWHTARIIGLRIIVEAGATRMRPDY